MHSEQKQIVEVAVPVPLRRLFDFYAPANNDTDITPGMRIKVPFGRRDLVGVVTQIKAESDVPENKIKRALELLDQQAIFSPLLLQLIDWTARYYLSPIGEVYDLALPALLRQGREVEPAHKKSWRLSEYGRSASVDELNRAPLQLAILKRFLKTDFLGSDDFKEETRSWRQAINALLEKGWLEEFEHDQNQPQFEFTQSLPAGMRLSDEQDQVLAELLPLMGEGVFSPLLLHGVTGSGKTEVYFELINKVLDDGQQALILVPEIGLTPQLMERIQSRFQCEIVSLHSGLTDSERHQAWWQAKVGVARIVVGTRSAVFTDFHDLGLLVVDEEHDKSFKQQEGVRYHARDVAVYRAQQHKIPILLCSATPSLESWANARSDKYRLLRLTRRVNEAELPTIELLNTNKVHLADGLSPMLVAAIKHTLQRGKQVMLYLNRRGFAPILYCGECGWKAQCHRCDSYLTFHERNNRVRCHHCGYEAKSFQQCGSCHQDTLVEVGEGTQRVEDGIAHFFPDARLLRIDRDSTSRKGSLEGALQQVEQHQVDIVVGTQLLTKGHDFPHVEMVGIINADQGLVSTDFRATEHLFQQLLQVAGRAGRRETSGRVYIQTAFPDNELFDLLKQHDYTTFADELLSLRQMIEFPPFGYFALLRAESVHQQKALQFLRQAKSQLLPQEGMQVYDAVPAPMEQRAGRFRAQLLISASSRSALHGQLRAWCAQLETIRASQVRWSLDIDPVDLF